MNNNITEIEGDFDVYIVSPNNLFSILKSTTNKISDLEFKNIEKELTKYGIGRGCNVSINVRKKKPKKKREPEPPLVIKKIKE